MEEPEETEPPTPPTEPEPLAVEDSAPEPAPPPAELPAEDSLTREEIQTLIHRMIDPPERKYQYINGMYVKIK